MLAVTFVSGHKHHRLEAVATKEYIIKGMSCPHCRATVAEGIAGVKGVRQVSVDLSTGKATVEGDQSDEDVAAAVRRVGFDVEL